MSKRYFFIELIFLIIPVALTWANAQFASPSLFAWGETHVNLLSSISFIIGIFGNIEIFRQNRNAEEPSSVWTVVSLLLIVLLTFFIIVGNSTSYTGL